MARTNGNAKSQSRNPKDWSNFEFVNIPLTEADKTHFKELQSTNPDELDDALVTLVEGEYKFSVTWDKSNECFIGSLTCRHPSDDNYGYVLSSRSDNLFEVMRLCVFKHVYLCENGSWPKDKRQSSWG